ncbi:hypothetical protein BJV78DRAFT_1236326 [Lactifluus subvellereus]|nr:hypothetical protein BJV78DRAFT_1268545 [Lactifluus subvellereus]KAI0248480.1 hypothetical protein BJV78DRAFT_1236326 [Lactifluus subvellereus]
MLLLCFILIEYETRISRPIAQSSRRQPSLAALVTSRVYYPTLTHLRTTEDEGKHCLREASFPH